MLGRLLTVQVQVHEREGLEALGMLVKAGQGQKLLEGQATQHHEHT